MTRVLIVDDMPENLYLLRALLQGHGHAVEEARHGAEALVKARQAPPQLIISDLLMPVMDGYTLLRHWRADERLKAIPFVVYTATYTEPKDERLAIEMGADAFILKPAEPAPFIGRIEEVLAQAARGELMQSKAPVDDETVQLKEYSEILVRKLEHKAFELEQSNRALLLDIAQRETAEAENRRMLVESARSRAALLSILEDQQQSEAAMKQSEARLRLAVTASHIGLWDWNLLTNEVYFSPEWKSQIGYAEDELPNRFDEWQSRLHPDDLAPTLNKVQRFIEDPAPGYAVEFRLCHKDGSWRWIFTQAQIMRDASGKAARMIGCHIDITQRKRDEQALRESEAKLRKLIDGLGSHMFVGLMTSDGVLIEANQPALVAAGLERGDVLDQPFEQTYWWAWSEPVQQRLRAAIRLAAAGTGSRYDVQIQVADKQLIWIDFSIQPLRGESGAVQYLIPSASVISERKQAEQALRESAIAMELLNRRLLDVQESERRAIARELHDSVGQNLAVLNLNLGITSSRFPPGTPSELLERIDDARKLIETTARQVRNLMADLRPAVLDDFGLLAALRAYAATFSKRVGVAVVVAGEELEPRPPLAIEITLFRIAQEALANAAKHARAQQVTVTLAATPHSLSLSVADDGVGFDPQAIPASQPHWGVATMRERAEAIGAALSIESAPGQGTRVTVQIARAPA